MKRVGLTGSIGAGKSEAARFLRAQGIAVHDADAAVHEIYTYPETIQWLTEKFPEAMKTGEIDKALLGKIVFGDSEIRKIFENFIHPRVAEHRAAFMGAAKLRGEKIAVCDIPLLFETHAEKEFDETWLLTAPDDIRLARVLARPGMTAEKFRAIDAAQMPQDEKIKLASAVIDNSGTIEDLHRKLLCLIGQK